MMQSFQWNDAIDFDRFQLERDQRTDGPTDQRTDKASYRVACPQLKTIQEEMEKKKEMYIEIGLNLNTRKKSGKAAFK